MPNKKFLIRIVFGFSIVGLFAVVFFKIHSQLTFVIPFEPKDYQLKAPVFTPEQKALASFQRLLECFLVGRFVPELVKKPSETLFFPL